MCSARNACARGVHAEFAKHTAPAYICAHVYRNEKKNLHTNKAQHMIYADDTQILITGPSHPIAGLVTAANSKIAAICGWAWSNLIRLNSNKTGAMLCGGRFRISSALEGGPPRLFVDDVPIVNSASLKIFGCIITPSLSWTLQMNRVSSSVHRVLHAVRHNRHALPHALRQRLVTALVFPYLNYAAPLILDLDVLNSARFGLAVVMTAV
uniref:Reverse transcriptase domain-containing protein n=1 Tax=Trichogramma kaykai TaxID=54128 RepID=A0ABD2X0S8_9HYME